MISRIKSTFAKVLGWVINWSTKVKRWGKDVCISIIYWVTGSGTVTAGLRKKFYTVVGDGDRKAIIFLFWDFISIEKYYKDWDTNIEMVKEWKSVSNWDSHESVESEAVKKFVAKTTSFI